MHLHSTQSLITKWPGTIYASVCLSCRSPTVFSLGMLHFPPASLLGDGWLQLSTNNHSRSIWLHSSLSWLRKQNSYMEMAMFYARFIVCLGLFFVMWCSHKKRIFSEQIHLIDFLQGPHGQTFKWLQAFKPDCFFPLKPIILVSVV